MITLVPERDPIAVAVEVTDDKLASSGQYSNLGSQVYIPSSSSLKTIFETLLTISFDN
jgi:hypothetical protein